MSNIIYFWEIILPQQHEARFYQACVLSGFCKKQIRFHKYSFYKTDNKRLKLLSHIIVGCINDDIKHVFEELHRLRVNDVYARILYEFDISWYKELR